MKFIRKIILEEKKFEKLYKENFSNGLIAFARAITKGAKTAILTARGGYDNHKDFISTIENLGGGFFNYKYFLNDDIRSKRLSFISETHYKKLHIMLEFLFGFKIQSDGINYRNIKFDKVKLYDDEEKNLSIQKKILY